MASYGWIGKLKEIKENKTSIVPNIIEKFQKKELVVSVEQILAWEDSINFIIQHFPNHLDSIYFCFEYFLPRMDQRRPDVILFFKGKIVVLEFKMKSSVKKRDILQTINYREDILKYHKETWKKNISVDSFLVITKNGNNFDKQHEIDILTANNFNTIFKTMENFPMEDDHIKQWIRSEYEPLPSVVDGAMSLFKDGSFPEIKNIQDGEIPKTQELINKIIASRVGKKQLIMVTGVPGAGKTLLALKTSYDCHSDNIGSIYISGNGPLISILQKELESHAIITGVLNYVKTYRNKLAPEEIIVFDEAQRAWDSERMSKGNYSEVEALLDIGNRIFEAKHNVVILAMIGHGQEIHKGEERGIKLWMEEIDQEKFQDWEVYAPNELQKFFKSTKVHFHRELFINTSIRSNFIDVTPLKDAILNVDIEQGKKTVEQVYTEGYELYFTRDLNLVKKYLNTKNSSSCLIGSSGVNSKDYSKIFGKKMDSFVDPKDSHNWYKNRPNNIIATEFTIQGLDIDYPVVVFGGDYYISGDSWNISTSAKEVKNGIFNNTNKLMKNIYNVLLTRGRKGILFYLPENVTALDETARFMEDIGVERV